MFLLDREFDLAFASAGMRSGTVPLPGESFSRPRMRLPKKTFRRSPDTPRGSSRMKNLRDQQRVADAHAEAAFGYLDNPLRIFSLKSIGGSPGKPLSFGHLGDPQKLKRR